MSNHLTIGILAHVDAGKTTLSEAILYQTGTIRQLGRVDHKNAFLDNNPIEQNRGITVFSKEARFVLGEEKSGKPSGSCACEFTLLDTPGHADFSTEMERTLRVLDYAILLVSGPDGVQSHTRLLWKLLGRYNIPTFVFVNKMDRPGTDKDAILSNLKSQLNDGIVESSNPDDLAMCDEDLMEEYLESGSITADNIKRAITRRQVFPVLFGSALKNEGVAEFLQTLATFTDFDKYDNTSDSFGAIVYKISRDKQGARQTHLKVTSGILKNKMPIGDEKIDQIRLYSGLSFTTISEATPGMICTVTGLTQTAAGQCLGSAASLDPASSSAASSSAASLGAETVSGSKAYTPLIEPALIYQMILPESTDPVVALSKLKELEEEDPTLHFRWNEELQEIHVQVMGSLELEILQHLIETRFDLNVHFGGSSIIYKETISEPVIGIGHYEPLRHYAEVHLLLEPLPSGSGMQFASRISEDKLDRNWQRLILGHLVEKEHKGVLTGSPITDMRITLINGRAHLKHTEGGDFRQATYRAVRQGLRKAECILLEPVYSFRLRVPTENVGRGLSDMQRLGARCELQGLADADSTGMSIITGTGPVSTLADYQLEVNSYTKGLGKFSAALDGYAPCHNQDEVVEAEGYIPEQDLSNPTASIFCDHGGALYVDWDKVDGAAHLEIFSVADLTGGNAGRTDGDADLTGSKASRRTGENSRRTDNIGPQRTAAGDKELEEIFQRTYGKSKRDETLRRENFSKGRRSVANPGAAQGSSDFTQSGEAGMGNSSGTGVGNGRRPGGIKKPGKGGESEPLLIIDGYNVVFAWEELKALAASNIDSAREALLDVLANYQGYRRMKILVVFDGYKVSGGPGSVVEMGDIKVVYTKEAETADRFIEKTVYELGRKFDVTVVTSDRLVQMAAMGDGATRLSSREFYAEVTGTSEQIRDILRKQQVSRNRPFEEVFDK